MSSNQERRQSLPPRTPLQTQNEQPSAKRAKTESNNFNPVQPSNATNAAAAAAMAAAAAVAASALNQVQSQHQFAFLTSSSVPSQSLFQTSTNPPSLPPSTTLASSTIAINPPTMSTPTRGRSSYSVNASNLPGYVASIASNSASFLNRTTSLLGTPTLSTPKSLLPVSSLQQHQQSSLINSAITSTTTNPLLPSSSAAALAAAAAQAALVASQQQSGVLAAAVRDMTRSQSFKQQQQIQFNQFQQHQQQIQQSQTQQQQQQQQQQPSQLIPPPLPSQTPQKSLVGLAIGLQQTQTQSQIQPHQPKITPATTTTNTTSSEPFPPHQASWFSVDSIHEIEKRAFPEFFSTTINQTANVGLSASLYKEYRDYMVQTSQQYPNQYLSFTQCRRYLSGDVCILMKIHMFLEHWGLINNRTLSSTYSPFGTNDSASSSYIGTPIENPYQVNRVIKRNGGLAAEVSAKLPTPPPPPTLKHSLETHPFIYPTTSTTKLKPETTSPTNTTTNSMNEFPKTADEEEQEEKNSVWTDQETALLFEGLEKYPNDWELISEHVATKTKQQCIEHFLRLPIEDQFLENQISQVNQSSQQSSNSNNNNNSNNSLNPIETMIQFLVVNSNSDASKAAIKAAQEIIMNQKHEESEEIEVLSSSVMGITGVKAKELAEKEESKIRELINQVIEIELKKIEAKMTQLVSREKFLDEEWALLARAQRQLLSDHLIFSTNSLTNQQQQLQQLQEQQIPIQIPLQIQSQQQQQNQQPP